MSSVYEMATFDVSRQIEQLNLHPVRKDVSIVTVQIMMKAIRTRGDVFLSLVDCHV